MTKKLYLTLRIVVQAVQLVDAGVNLSIMNPFLFFSMLSSCTAVTDCPVPFTTTRCFSGAVILVERRSSGQLVDDRYLT